MIAYMYLYFFLSSGLHEVFIGSHSHHMFAVVAESGELLWKTRLGDRIESSASVSICGNYIIVGKELITEQVDEMDEKGICTVRYIKVRCMYVRYI